MSYSIVFETKIVILSDGRILHFDRRGCNNDDAGRSKDDFTAKIYTKKEFFESIEEYKSYSHPYNKSEPGDWDLKIGSRYATSYDYGEHLQRMYKRALPYSEFIQKYHFYCTVCTGIQMREPEEKLLSVTEFEAEYYELLNRTGRMSYRRLEEAIDVNDELHVVSCIEMGEPLILEILNHKKFKLS